MIYRIDRERERGKKKRIKEKKKDEEKNIQQLKKNA